MPTRGERLKRLREEMGLHQNEAADKIGVLKQTLYKYENDLVDNIPQDKIEALAMLYGVEPTHIVGWDEEGVHLRARATYARILAYAERYAELTDIAEKYAKASEERKQIVRDVLGVNKEKED